MQCQKGSSNIGTKCQRAERWRGLGKQLQVLARERVGQEEENKMRRMERKTAVVFRNAESCCCCCCISCCCCCHRRRSSSCRRHRRSSSGRRRHRRRSSSCYCRPHSPCRCCCWSRLLNHSHSRRCCRRRLLLRRISLELVFRWDGKELNHVELLNYVFRSGVEMTWTINIYFNTYPCCWRTAAHGWLRIHHHWQFCREVQTF